MYFVNGKWHGIYVNGKIFKGFTGSVNENIFSVHPVFIKSWPHILLLMQFDFALKVLVLINIIYHKKHRDIEHFHCGAHESPSIFGIVDLIATV